MLKDEKLKTLDDIKNMPMKELAQDIQRLGELYPHEYETAKEMSGEMLEVHNSKWYDVLVGAKNPTVEGGLRMDSACFYHILGILIDKS